MQQPSALRVDSTAIEDKVARPRGPDEQGQGMTKQQKTYPCYRCAGKGEISGFRHVLGGVCFKCKGSGIQHNKPAAKGILWAVLDSNGLHSYNVKATTAAKAVTKAQGRFVGIQLDSAFKSERDMTNARAVPYAEYWTDERIAEAHAEVNA
jgi:hypothetical protein